MYRDHCMDTNSTDKDTGMYVWIMKWKQLNHDVGQIHNMLYGNHAGQPVLAS